jgi:hypothetical protein
MSSKRQVARTDTAGCEAQSSTLSDSAMDLKRLQRSSIVIVKAMVEDH